MHSTALSATLKTMSTAILITCVCMACQPAPDANGDGSETANKATTQATVTATPPLNPPLQKLSQPISQPITIVAIGDSLTKGYGVSAQDSYPAQLEAQLQQAGYVNVSVINLGVSGETSSGLVNRLQQAVKLNPDITILSTGANDAMRGVAVATIDANIRTAIKQLQASGSTVILGGMDLYDDMGDDYVNHFSRIYRHIAADTGVAYIPFLLKGVAGDANLNQKDAIHPTAEGYTYVVNNNILPVLMPVLENMVADQAVSN